MMPNHWPNITKTTANTTAATGKMTVATFSRVSFMVGLRHPLLEQPDDFLDDGPEDKS
jgi:hypothetical protein